jgi:hypothetical protein
VSRENAAIALDAYVTREGDGEMAEPHHWQASDLITDLLMCFGPETADLILHRVQRDTEAERAEQAPLFPPSEGMDDDDLPTVHPLALPVDPLPRQRAAVHELLTEFWDLTDRHRARVDQYRDASGDADDDFYAEYDEARSDVSIEAANFLEAAMQRLEGLFPLPPGREVTFPGTDGATFTVTTGVLDKRARAAFIQGQCHAMARALSGVTGWPMAMVIADECVYDPDLCDDSRDDEVCACRLEHVVVVRPDGMLVDVNGAHHPGQIPNHEGQQYVALLEGDWEFICSSPHWRRPALAIARTFTAAVLDLPDNT